MNIDHSYHHIANAVAGLLQRFSEADHCLVSIVQKLIHHTAQGHVCLPLSLLDNDESLLVDHHSMIGDGHEITPFVKDKGAIYSYRFWRDECWVAQDLILRSTLTSTISTASSLESLSRLFPTSNQAIDWQKVAAAMALLNPFCVITGGPGTGKTTTVVRLLLALQSMSDVPLRIALTAPTGKATARLQESVDNTVMQESSEIVLDYTAKTIHRLLGIGHVASTAKFHQHHQLALDVLIVDEASMLDLLMFKKLLQALSHDTRLILIGDQYQLASVDAGSVLADICCGKLNVYSESRAEQLSKMTSCDVQVRTAETSVLQDNIVQLEHSYRFASGGGIGQMAEAVQKNDMDTVRQLLSANNDQVTYSSSQSIQSLVTDACASYREYLLAIEQGESVEVIFSRLAQYRILVATRSSSRGVDKVNHLIESELSRMGLIDANELFYSGRPILVLRNSYQHQLFNGDVGVILPDGQGELMATFLVGDRIIRKTPHMLPEHETVYAMTIHKSQGSEFDKVALLMPLQSSPIVTRELLYTGITRAKNTLNLYAPMNVIEYACNTATERFSRLEQRLQNDH